MAKVIKVKDNESIASIARKNNIPLAELRAENKGVTTVKTGQVIKIPKIKDDVYTPPVNPAVKGTAGYGGVYKPNVQSGGMLSPDKIAPGNPAPSGFLPAYRYGQQQTVIPKPAASAYTGTAGYWGAYNQPAPTLGSSSYMNPAFAPQPVTPQGYAGYSPDKQIQVNKQQTVSADKQGGQFNATLSVPPRPVNADGTIAVYTGNPLDPNTAAWKAYWNAVAKLGRDPNAPTPAPTVMTREEIWQMKAASRRKKMRGMTEADFSGGGGQSYQPFQYSEQTQSYIPETLVRSITWGI